MTLLTEKQVLVKLGIGRTFFYGLRKKNGFPKPGHLCDGEKNLWLESDVEEWIAKNWKKVA